MGGRETRYIGGDGELPRLQRDLDQINEQRQHFLRMAERALGATVYVEARMKALEDEENGDATENQSPLSGEGASS